MSVFDKLANNEWNAWTAIACRIANENSKSQWDKEIYSEAQDGLSAISEHIDDEDIINMLTYFLWSFQTFRQLKHDVDSLLYGGIKKEIRIRSLLLPLSTSLVEGCLVNLLRALMCGLSSLTGKDYCQLKDMQPMLDVLNKNGFSQLARIPNVGLRNAISHGGVIVRTRMPTCDIEYTFTKGVERHQEKMTLCELEDLVLRYLDAVCGLMLAFCDFFDAINTAESFHEISDTYVRNMYIGLSMSDKDFICLDASEATVTSQLNYVFQTMLSDNAVLLARVEALFPEIRMRCPGFEKYLITCSHPRMPANFVRARGSDIDKYISDGRPAGLLIDGIKKSGDCLWQGISLEAIDEYEAQYYRFPFFDTENLKIYDIEDVSNQESKRLKAMVFVGFEQDKNQLIRLIRMAVDWVKKLHNPPDPRMQIKHGDMEADCVYLNVFRSCRSRDRSLLENNDNFICQVEYCLKAEFRLSDDNAFLKYLYQNSEWFNSELRLLWRDGVYLSEANKTKVGRNELCPCGSGLKYKKCCGR